MSGIDNAKTICQSIYGRMIVDVPGHQNLCLFLDGRIDHTLTGPAADCDPADESLSGSFLLFRAIAADSFNAHPRPHVIRKICEAHCFGQIPHPSDSFDDSVYFPCHLQHMGILQIQLFFIDVRHAEYIKIRVHGVVADLVFNQRQNSSADKRIIVYFPNAVKQERMMRDEKIRLCRIVSDAKADFIKTSTGFGSAGAKVEDIILMKNNVDPEVRIKAAGGIRTEDAAKEMIANGADRIGASRLGN